MNQVTVIQGESVKKKSHLSFPLKYLNIIVEIISVLFILLFVYAAVSKLIDYQKKLVLILIAFAGWVAWIIPVKTKKVAI